MSEVNIETLYKCFGVLADAKEKAGEHTSEYEEILQGVSGNTATKRLSAQFIARFLKYFPEKTETAINAIMDLCEDEDISIRKAAVKEIPNICKQSNQNLPRLADVLVQLMQSDDSNELSIVHLSLRSLFKINCKGTLTGLFTQINEGDEVIRERAIRFMCEKFPKLPTEILTKEIEEYVFAECKKILEDVTGEEFQQFVKLLSSLEHLRTIQGRQQITKLIADQMQQEKFDGKDADSVKRVLQCLSMALPLISKNVHSMPFIKYLCEHVLPNLSDIEKDKEEDSRLEILKLLAEMTTHPGPPPTEEDIIVSLFDALLEYMPLPPDVENQAESATEPKLDFSYVECLMYAFYSIASKQPTFLTNEEEKERLRDFRVRLQYFARGLSVYIRQLKSVLDKEKTPENKMKVIALKTCNNINALIKDLFHNPPSYKTTINLSWKPVAAPATAQKRHSIEANGDSKSKMNREDQQIYKAPSGKYSSTISPKSYSRGRGGYRGRGRRGRFQRY